MADIKKEIDNLPEGHKNYVDHECFDYPSFWHYTFSKSNYHFDRTKDDSEHPGINLKLKFRFKKDIMEEVNPFIKEQSYNVYKNDVQALYNAWWYHKNGINGFDHCNFKESLKPEKHPTLLKIVDWFQFEGEVQPLVMQMKPGMFDIYHVDEHDGHPSGYGVKKDLVRLIVNLTDWHPGQFLIWGNRNIQQWQSGDTIIWDKNIPHGVANVSHHTRYVLRITGIPSQTTLDKMNKGGLIDIF